MNKPAAKLIFNCTKITFDLQYLKEFDNKTCIFLICYGTPNIYQLFF